MVEQHLGEFQSIGETPWGDIPDSTGSIRIGRIVAADVEGIIKGDREGDTVYFWLERQGVDIAFAQIGNKGGHAALLYAFVLPEFQRRGVMSELMHWIIRNNSQPLINDTQLSPNGLKLWKGLMKSLSPSIIDISTGKKYNIHDPHVPKPEDDSAQPDAYDPVTGIGQRYFYLVEAPEYFKHLVEGVEYTFHCDINRHQYHERSRHHFPRYFHDGDE